MHEHHMLYESCYLEHSRKVEVGMLHLVWFWWRFIRDLLRVSSMSLTILDEGLTFFSWAHEICTKDNEERAIVVAAMNEMAYVLQAWLPLIVWQQVEAPNYRKGFVTITFLSAALIVTAITIRILHARELAQEKVDRESAQLDESTSSEDGIEASTETLDGKKSST